MSISLHNRPYTQQTNMDFLPCKIWTFEWLPESFYGRPGIGSAIQRAKQLMEPRNRIILDFAAESLGNRKDPLQHFYENARKIPEKGAVSLKRSTVLSVPDLTNVDCQHRRHLSFQHLSDVQVEHV